MKIKRAFVVGALVLVAGWNLWSYLKPDRFFVDLGLNVPMKFIVSHRSPFGLRSIEDQLILRIPNSQVRGVQKAFATQKHFEDVSTNLPHRYADFRAGYERFFPTHCPKRFRAGRFYAYDRNREVYFCRFLFDQDDANFTTLYLSSVSSID